MRGLQSIANVADMREAARRALPHMVFEFLEGGAFDEKTLRANCADFDDYAFLQRAMVDVAERSTATTMVGQPASLPVAISPTGLSGVLPGGEGEILAARAAKAAGVPFCLAMLSVRTLEEVSAAAGPVWLQMAMLKDRGLMTSFIERAKAAQCPVLVLTTTWAAPSQLNRLIRARATSLPPKITPRTIWQLARKPGWIARTLAGTRVAFNNFPPPFDADLGGIRNQLHPAATWAEVEWLRSVWPGKLLIKGPMTAPDVEAAIAVGADAISVSNHGGNQLDGAVSTIAVLPHVLEAAAGRIEVLLDGGVRSGQDVMKAVALGASGVLIGRAHLYGLAAYGEPGVAKVLAMLRRELDITLALTGLRRIEEATPAILWDQKRGRPVVAAAR